MLTWFSLFLLIIVFAMFVMFAMFAMFAGLVRDTIRIGRTRRDVHLAYLDIEKFACGSTSYMESQSGVTPGVRFGF